MRPTISRSQARARGRQHLDVAGMQDVEAAIGEADAQPLPAPVRQMRIEIAASRHDLLFGRQRRMRQDFPPQFRRRHGGGALLADRDRGRRIRHPQRRLPVGPGRQRQRQHGGDRVARAGDVAHLDRQRRHVDRLAAANHQRHAVFALRHQHGLAIGEIPSRPAPRRQCSGRYRRGCGWLPQTPCGWASAAWRRDRSRNWRSWDRRSRACRASCAASMMLRMTRAVSTPLA